MNYKKIQQVLKNEGFYTGRIDGKFGNRSKIALRKYQTYHGLTVDGIIGKQVTREMFHQISERHINSDNHKYPLERDVESFFGRPGKNQVRITLPYKMVIAWDTSKTVSTILCNRKVADDMKAIFQEVLDVYGIAEIRRLGLDMYGGCLNVRKIRGGTRYSTHAYGISIDIDPANNRLRWGSDKAKLAGSEYDKFWEIVYKHGFYSLGKEKDYDWMHIQACRPHK